MDITTMIAIQHSLFVAAIKVAFNNLMSTTGVRFIEETIKPEYIRFVKSAGKNSQLGWRKNGVNTINLYNYNMVGIVMDEIISSIWGMHEQYRPDRDLHVIVDVSRVISGYEHNYNIFPTYAGHGAFNFQSVMLYNSWGFTKDPNLASVTKINGFTFDGQRAGISAGDIAGLKNLYFQVAVGGIYRITSVYVSTKSLDIYGGSPADRTRIIIWPSHSNNNQKFILRKEAHGYYQIKSLLNANKVLTVRGNSTGFALKYELGLRLEVSGGNSANATNVVVGTSSTTSQVQRFNLTRYSKLKSPYSWILAV